MSGIIFFSRSILAISALFVAPKISAWLAAPQLRRGVKIKKKKELCPSRDQQWCVCVFLFYCDKFLRRIESDCIKSKSLGMPIASGKPDSRMSVDPSSFDAASTSKKKKTQKTQTILRLETCTTKENLLTKTIKLGGNPSHTEPVLQLTRKVKSIWKRHGTTISTYRWTHRTTWKPSSPWSGRSMEHNQATLWNIWMWIFGYLGNVHEYHSSSSSSSRKKLREEP